jgi:hypothetical protein
VRNPLPRQRIAHTLHHWPATNAGRGRESVRKALPWQRKSTTFPARE